MNRIVLFLKQNEVKDSKPDYWCRRFSSSSGRTFQIATLGIRQ